MRQLDLFAAFDTNTLPEKPEEQVASITHEENIAEEHIAPKVETPDPTNSSEKTEQAPADVSAKVDEVVVDNPIIQHAIEDIRSHGGELEAVEVIQPSAANFTHEDGAVIFTDGKITVKIKAKPVVKADIAVKEKRIVAPRLKREPVTKIAQKRGRKSFKEIDAEVDLVDIPEDEILFQKQYYPISQVAQWFNVNTSLLRFWENEFDILKPRKNRKGDRMFRPEDIKNLQLIYHLLRQRKYTIEGAKEYIKTNKKKADIQLQLTNTLQKFKGFLLELKANLQP